MPELAVMNKEGKETSKVQVSDAVFDAPVHQQAVYLAVKRVLASQRAVLSSTKTRAEVSGGGRKPFRQKGTGRGRQGSIRAPHWVGGGVAFGPTPDRNYEIKLPKKVYWLAMRSVLSEKLRQGELVVVDELKLEAIKTRELSALLQRLLGEKAGNVLVVLEGRDDIVEKSARNLPWAKVRASYATSVYDLLKYDNVVITTAALQKLEEACS